MICPHCKKEINDHDVCPFCHKKIAEVDTFNDEELDLVTVFKTDDPGLIPIIKSLLDDAHIPYKTNGDGLQTIYAFGKTIFQVLKHDEALANEILLELKEHNME